MMYFINFKNMFLHISKHYRFELSISSDCLLIHHNYATCISYKCRHNWFGRCPKHACCRSDVNSPFGVDRSFSSIIHWRLFVTDRSELRLNSGALRILKIMYLLWKVKERLGFNLKLIYIEMVVNRTLCGFLL